MTGDIIALADRRPAAVPPRREAAAAANTVAATGDTIIGARRGAAVKHGFAQESRNA